MRSGSDPGLDVIDFVYRSMNIDEQWSERNERGFTCWGHRLAQQVWAEAPRLSQGYWVTRVHARAAVLREVPWSGAIQARVSALNMYGSLSAYCREADGRRLSLDCNVYVHHGNAAWLKRLFACAVALQAAEAEIAADMLSSLVGGAPDESGHPINGPRVVPDNMLDIIAQLFAPASAGPSACKPGEFEQALAMAPEPWVLASGDEQGLTAEFPFTDSTPAVAGGRGTALLIASAAEQHPRLGSGLLVRLALPVLVDALRGNELAHQLNWVEATQWNAPHFLGAWCLDANSTLTFVTFVPSAVYAPGLLHALILSSAVRARWAGEYIADLRARPTSVG